MREQELQLASSICQASTTAGKAIISLGNTEFKNVSQLFSGTSLQSGAMQSDSY